MGRMVDHLVLLLVHRVHNRAFRRVIFQHPSLERTPRLNSRHELHKLIILGILAAVSATSTRNMAEQTSEVDLDSVIDRLLEGESACLFRKHCAHAPRF